MGIRIANEKQRITINADNITGGTTTFSFEDFFVTAEFTFSYNSDVSVWASNFEAALRAAVIVLSTVTVTGSVYLTTTIFEVNFIDDDGRKRQPVIKFVSSALTGTNIDDPVIVVLEKGGPANDIAPDIDVDTTPPGNIEFKFTNENGPFICGTLDPGEGIPIWAKRETLGSSEFRLDDFVIKGCRWWCCI